MGEEETRLLLRLREDLERRIRRLQAEMEDLSRAIAEIDRVIVKSGFQQPTPTIGERAVPAEEAVSIKSKDGALLGTIEATDREIVFTPVDGVVFTVSTPPFQSFLMDRVLANMRTSDEARAARGEIPPENVISYEAVTEDDRLVRLVIRNYGDERRLREIRSSLRWTFDKMYEKLGQGSA